MRRRLALLTGPVLALTALGCDDGGGGADGRLEVAARGVEATTQVRLWVRREAADDAGLGDAVDKESTLSTRGGLLVERPLVIEGDLVPPGAGRVVVHAVALLDGVVVGVGDGSALPSERKTVTVTPVPDGCDLDGDTFLDCRNLRAGCCGAVAPEDQARATDCVDDPDIDPPPAPDLKRREAARAHPFAAESELDYAVCENGLDEDCQGGDVRCAQIDADGDGSPLAEDCDDDDPSTYPGAPDGSDPEDRDCDGDPGADEEIDRDQDGYPAQADDPERQDCDDADPRRNPGALELPCSGVDEDCDGADPCAMDDLDGDGYAVPEDCDPFDAGVFPGAPERCGDGTDQDCDGEDLACAPDDLDGDGSGVDDCADDDPARYPGAPERCDDGVDQDCDGEDLRCPPGADADGDGFLAPADCDDDSPRAHPGAAERCNRADDDCDGIVDEGNPRVAANGDRHADTCSIDLGLCSAGPLVCAPHPDDEGAAVFLCLGVTGSEEVCDGLDNDCNGDVDDPPPGMMSLPDEGQATCGPPAARGECRPGTLFCADGQLADCRAAVEASAEDCNGLDDDCDGRTDEGVADRPLTASCFDGPGEVAATGICRAGVRTCDAGQFSACVSQIVPEDEACNGLDDDCDGRVDEIDAVRCYNFDPATEGVGVCRSGVRACADGALGPCDGQVGPSDELCDGLDNDCDGRVDQIERDCFAGDPARAGVGTCRAGRGTCVDGAFSECAGAVGPAPERCDQLDTDCDGAVDEDFDLQSDPANCGACGRACAPGETCCAGCRPLDSVQNCGACGAVCGPESDCCAAGPGGAACACGDGPPCAGGLRCLPDGTCGCETNENCGPDGLCCDRACVTTDLARCTGCDDGACDPERASACGERRCVCGDTRACPEGTQCAVQDGEFRCVGCVDNTQCPGDSICCGQVCVPTRAERQCTGCGTPCDGNLADRCVGEDGAPERRCACGDGAPCEPGAFCVADAPAPFCAACRADGDCGGETPFCLGNTCVACDPGDHRGCGGDQLCCDRECVDIGPDRCATCAEGCADDAADSCADRACRCGDGPACAGATPFCVDGACRGCRADEDCGGATPVCREGACVACRPAGHLGCAPDELCCAQGDLTRCQATNAQAAGQCTGCDEGCPEGTADRCADRACACGDGPPCDPESDAPVCADGRCVECTANVDCNGRDGGNFCVDDACVPCNPVDHAGCRAQQLCCVNGAAFKCENTKTDGRCEACALGCDDDLADTCVDRGCACGDTPACAPGTFCVDGLCRACRDHDDCGDDARCCEGRCFERGFGAGRICEACDASCDPLAADRCVDGDCHCGDDDPCGGGSPLCVGGECVACVANPDCPADEPICEGNRCRACAEDEAGCPRCDEDEDCAGDPDGPFCVESRCAPCLSTGRGCDFDSASPICDGDPTRCRGCTENGHCNDRNDLAVADCAGDEACELVANRRDLCITSGPRQGECRECNPTTNEGCGGGRPICAADFTCRACASNRECIERRLPHRCDPNNGRCR